MTDQPGSGPGALTPDDVAHVANLARLRLNDGELQQFTTQLSAVLEHAADIEALDLDDVAPTAHPFPLENVLRADVVSPSLDKDEVLAAAPAAESGQFKVPPVLGDDR